MAGKRPLCPGNPNFLATPLLVNHVVHVVITPARHQGMFIALEFVKGISKDSGGTGCCGSVNSALICGCADMCWWL